MSKITITTLFMVSILLLHTITYTASARPAPAFHDVTPIETPHMKDEDVQNINVEEHCKGAGREDCLMRRTMAAHLDYIYTQKEKP